ncbi:MAG: MBL fold metallo-hydrolase [Clostridiales bacterium]|nr:MBL fold metallo-hydrolase [Clostridiales bacterium]
MAGTATVTFFHHSGFSVEIQDTLLVFDYWRGENNELPKAAQLKNQELEKYKQILIFVTHDHEDHFDEAIYALDHEKLPITYVVSDDLPIGKRGKRMKAGETLKIGETEIRAFDSTDKGVSFYVTVGSMHVFHAGDLNLWHWREESTLREIAQAENAYYEAVRPIERLPIDIAMFPVDPRMGGLFDAGANHFIMAVKPRLFIPMHWQGRPEVALDFARRGRTKYTETLALTKPRERAELAFTEHELRIHVFTLAPDAFKEQEPEPEVPLETAYAPGDPFSDTDLPVKL